MLAIQRKYYYKTAHNGLKLIVICMDCLALPDFGEESHRIYKKDNKRMVIPHHSGKILHPKIIKELFEILND